MVSPWEFAALTAAVGVGALVQGTIGFGFALVSAPVLTLVDPSAVPSTLLVLSMPLNLAVLARERAHAEQRGAGEIVLGMIAGTAIAVGILRSVPEEQLTIAFGAAIVAAGIASALRPPQRPGASARVAAGLGSGVINTVAGTGGPLIALVYQHRAGPVMRSTLAATFSVAVVLSLAGQALGERLAWDQVRLALVLLPALLAGIALSSLAVRRVDHEALRRAVIVFVVVSGIAAIARGVL